MITLRRLCQRALALSITLAFVLTASLAAQQPNPNEFVPIDQLPPSEQLPGGVFVIVGYSFVWLGTMAYVWSVWRRLQKVESEMQTLERRRESTGR